MKWWNTLKPTRWITTCVYVTLFVMTSWIYQHNPVMNGNYPDASSDVRNIDTRTVNATKSSKRRYLLNLSDVITNTKRVHASPTSRTTGEAYKGCDSICETLPSPPDVSLLVTIHSRPHNKPQRNSIRETWGRWVRGEGSGVALVFIVGTRTPADPMHAGLIREALLYRDMVLVPMKDTYSNLTLKALAGLDWILRCCPNATAVLKADDDVYFTLPRLVSALKDTDDDLQDAMILGAVNKGAQVQRNGLWAVDRNLYPPATYPPYCAGNSYVMTASAVRTLQVAARRLIRRSHAGVIPIEDAFVTGLAAAAGGVRLVARRELPQWMTGPSRVNVCRVSRGTLWALHAVSYERMYDIHTTLTNGATNCTGYGDGVLGYR